MRINELFQGLESEVEILGNPSFNFRSLTPSSQEAAPGDLFVALRGEATDGHLYISQALQRGVGAVVCEKLPQVPDKSVTWVKCRDTKKIFAQLVKRYFDDPAAQLQLIGVTGTNGKTTITHLLEHLLQDRGTLLMGTVEYRLANKTVSAGNTTPGIYELTQWMKEATRGGARYGILEVSSHALKQERLAGLHFRTGIFTNLTQDHLDYHGTFEDYYEAKKRLFCELDCEISIVNLDDPYGERLFEELSPNQRKVISYSIGPKGDSFATGIELGLEETSFMWHVGEAVHPVKSCLIGRYNVYNLLAALTAALEEGLLPKEAVRRIEEFPGVPGRMERVADVLPFCVFVDYAHTPDALKNVLSSTQELTSRGGGNIITVVGCGGDRDKAKRPMMGSIAGDYSDTVILTSDNPRTEDPQRILQDMAQGLSGKFESIEDRKNAICTALETARPGDVVLILGKGHEDYQILGKEKILFSDREIVNDFAAAYSLQPGAR